MIEYLLGDRLCILEASMMLAIGYQWGKGDVVYAAAIMIVGAVVISFLQVWLLRK